jgi:hypothetical protein
VAQRQEQDRQQGEGARRGEGRGEGRGFGRGRGRGRGRFGGGGRRGGGGGYGSIVDAGPVLIALSPAAELVVFEPSGEAYNEVARYKVADGGTYAYPVPAGNGIYVKDQNHITLWTVE